MEKIKVDLKRRSLAGPQEEPELREDSQEVEVREGLMSGQPAPQRRHVRLRIVAHGITQRDEQAKVREGELCGRRKRHWREGIQSGILFSRFLTRFRSSKQCQCQAHVGSAHFELNARHLLLNELWQRGRKSPQAVVELTKEK